MVRQRQQQQSGVRPFVPAANFQGNFPTNGMQSMNFFGSSSQGGNAGMGGSLIPALGSQPSSIGGGLHRRTPSGNPIPQVDGVGNVSYEMLQSFMQRNADGSGGAGMT